MKKSKVIAVEFDPIFKHIYVTRLWQCPCALSLPFLMTLSVECAEASARRNP